MTLLLVLATTLPCQANDPVGNFEELWKTFDQRYAFFELHSVDWKAQHEKYRPRVTDTTTDAELFKIICEMLAPLDDGHVTIKAKGSFKKWYSPETEARFVKEFPSKKHLRALFETTGKTLGAAGFGKLKKATDLLEYSRSDTLGYLKILEFEGVSPKKVGPALDGIISYFVKLKGLIIDIRDNPGGTDKMVYTIANRFADKKRVGHSHITRKTQGDYSEPDTWNVQPAGPLQFTGPIVLLTSDASFSAADVFAMVMKELPHVTIAGEPTNGIFSNMLEKKLPNGWKVTLSYQRYRSADGICYEGRGIPVDIKVINTRKDLETGVDPVIKKALDILVGRD